MFSIDISVYVYVQASLFLHEEDLIRRRIRKKGEKYFELMHSINELLMVEKPTFIKYPTKKIDERKYDEK
jgi:hypothetical protein